MPQHTPGSQENNQAFYDQGWKDAVAMMRTQVTNLEAHLEYKRNLNAAAPRMLTLLKRLSDRLALRAMESHSFASINEKADIDEARAFLRDVEGQP